MMTSPRMLGRSMFYLIGTIATIISTSGSPCIPEEACHPPSVQLANSSYPLRRLNVSSTCGVDNSSLYCNPEYTVFCDNDTAIWCNGEHAPERMLEWASSLDDATDDLPRPTYWQSDNSIATAGAQPTSQYVQVKLHMK